MKNILVVANSNSFIYPLLKKDIMVCNIYKRFYSNKIFSKLNKIFYILFLRLGFKRFVLGEWYKFCDSKDYRIVFLDECGITSDIIRIINKRKENTAIYFWNIASKVSHLNLILNKAECKIYSFDSDDAKKYQLNYLQSIIPVMETEDTEMINDVFFYGQDKGRKSIVKQFEETFKNLRCDFTVIDDKDMSYIYPLSYPDYIKRAIKSKVIFEILQNGQSGETIRSVESVLLKRKLITNNLNAKNLLINRDNVFVFDKIENINSDELFTFVNSNYIDSDIINEEIKKRTPVAWFDSIFNK